jgi:hypothetical protein
MNIEKQKQTKESLKETLDHLLEIYQGLPEGAKYSPVNHSELESLLLLMRAWFEVD